VHQFCRIGKMAIVGGCSGIRQDVAPFMLVEGDPGRTRMINKVGLERNGVSPEAQSALKQAHRIFFREGLTTPNALARIEQEVPLLPEVQYFVQFVRTSERGVTK
jgi:UDP-N-acetylglucosamine acyltransferase